MNISIHDFDINDNEIAGQTSSDRSSSLPRMGKKAPIAQKRKAPQRFNGIHRRRRKKIMW